VMVIQDSHISKRHCEIVRKPHKGSDCLEEVWLVDRSTNGCYVNGHMVGRGKQTLLNDADTVILFLEMAPKRKSK